jgi:hypothetical protein
MVREYLRSTEPAQRLRVEEKTTQLHVRYFSVKVLGWSVGSHEYCVVREVDTWLKYESGAYFNKKNLKK